MFKPSLVAGNCVNAFTSLPSSKCSRDFLAESDPPAHNPAGNNRAMSRALMITTMRDVWVMATPSAVKLMNPVFNVLDCPSVHSARWSRLALNRNFLFQFSADRQHTPDLL